MNRKQGYDLYLAQQYLTESELRVARQEQLITTLKNQGRSTDEAKRILENFELTVVQLRNHLQVMQALVEPDHTSKT